MSSREKGEFDESGEGNALRLGDELTVLGAEHSIDGGPRPKDVSTDAHLYPAVELAENLHRRSPRHDGVQIASPDAPLYVDVLAALLRRDTMHREGPETHFAGVHVDPLDPPSAPQQFAGLSEAHVEPTGGHGGRLRTAPQQFDDGKGADADA